MLHHRLGPQTDLRARIHGFTQHVSGRELRNSQRRCYSSTMRALARCWRPEHQDDISRSIALAYARQHSATTAGGLELRSLPGPLPHGSKVGDQRLLLANTTDHSMFINLSLQLPPLSTIALVHARRNPYHPLNSKLSPRSGRDLVIC